MSNLKKYLKVYKEDAKHKKAFEQYMTVISENQDFFTHHEVNEFFTDMIKDGTLVYDEGSIGDYYNKYVLPTLGGAAIAIASLLPTNGSLSAKTPLSSQIKNENKMEQKIELNKIKINYEKGYFEVANIKIKELEKKRSENVENAKKTKEKIANADTKGADLREQRIKFKEILENHIDLSFDINNLKLQDLDGVTQKINKDIDPAYKVYEKSKTGIDKLSNEEKERFNKLNLKGLEGVLKNIRDSSDDVLSKSNPFDETIKDNFLNNFNEVQIKFYHMKGIENNMNPQPNEN